MKLKTWAGIVAVAGLLLLFGLPSAIGQQPDEEGADEEGADEEIAGEFSGTYEVEGGKKAAQKKVDRAVQGILDDMSFIKRPFAEDKLKAKTKPCASLDVSFAGDKISVKCDDRPAYVSPMGNEKARYKSSEGATYALRQDIDGRTLTQTFVSEDGTRTNTMQLTPSGQTILLKARLESGQLPRPLEYRLTYEKK